MKKTICLSMVLFFSFVSVVLAHTYMQAMMMKSSATSAQSAAREAETQMSTMMTTMIGNKDAASTDRDACINAGWDNCQTHSTGHPGTCGGSASCCKCACAAGGTSWSTGTAYESSGDASHSDGDNEMTDGDTAFADGEYWLLHPQGNPPDYDLAYMAFYEADIDYDGAKPYYDSAKNFYSTANTGYSDAHSKYHSVVVRHNP